jgi:hypothetical protein
MQQIFKNITNERFTTLLRNQKDLEAHLDLFNKVSIVHTDVLKQEILEDFKLFLELIPHVNKEPFEKIVTGDLYTFLLDEGLQYNLQLTYRKILPYLKSRRLKNIMFLEICNNIQKLDNSTKFVDYEVLKHIQQNAKQGIEKLLKLEKDLKQYTTLFYYQIHREVIEFNDSNIDLNRIVAPLGKILKDDWVINYIEEFFNLNVCDSRLEKIYKQWKEVKEKINAIS